MKSKNLFLALILIILLGGFFRFYDLGVESLWFDECFTYNFAGRTMPEIVDVLKESDVHPILYYVMMRFSYLNLGTSEFDLRLPSVFFGISSIILIYYLGKEFSDKKTGLLASLLLAISYTAILYSQEAKMYSLFMSASIFSILYYIKFMKMPSKNNLIVLGIANAVLLHTHVVGIFINIALFIYYLTCYIFSNEDKEDLNFIIFKNYKSKFDLKKYMYSVFLTFLIYLPWLPIFYYQFNTLFVHMLRDKLIEKLGLDAYPVIVLLGFIFVALYFILVYYLSRNKQLFQKIKQFYTNIKFNENIFALLLVTYLIFDIFVSNFFFKPVHFVRFSIFILPLAYVLLSKFLFNIKKQKLFTFLLLIFLVVSSIELYNYYAYDNKEQFREVAEYIEVGSDNNDILFLHSSYIATECFNYYYSGNIQQVELMYENESDKIIDTENSGFIYLLLTHNYKTKEFFKDEMDKHYRLVKHSPFIGIDVYKYIKP